MHALFWLQKNQGAPVVGQFESTDQELPILEDEGRYAWLDGPLNLRALELIHYRK